MDYQIIYSNRKTVSILIDREGAVTVRSPRGVAKREIKRIVENNRDWIEKKKNQIEAERPASAPPFSEQERMNYVNRAMVVFPERAAHFAGQMGVSYNRITIREQKTRWGSCSSKGNLNFNWRLLLAPPEVLDYVVVHELAHLKEMNHSPQFYREVAAVLPDYRERQIWLKKNGRMLWQRS